MSNLLKHFWLFQRAAALAIGVDGMWGKTTVNITCSTNSACTSAETVDFAS
jgi:hypothetical protein